LTHPTQHLCENQVKFIMAYGQLGQPEKAEEHFARCKAEAADFSTGWMVNSARRWNFSKAHIRMFLEGFAKAGYSCVLPDCKVD
jgi:hypothetical protein